MPNELESNLNTPEKALENDDLLLKTGISIAEVMNRCGISPEDLDGWENVLLEGDLPYCGGEIDWGEDVGGEILSPYEE